MNKLVAGLILSLSVVCTAQQPFPPAGNSWWTPYNAAWVGTLAAAVRQPLPLRPDPNKTPGAVTSPAPSLKQLCTPGYSSKVRNVPDSEKTKVFAAYGIARSGNFEVDHLISLELGGSNDIFNLWPQSYLTKTWNARQKDKLENRLHWLVCHGQLSVYDAQAAVSRDWIAAYVKYVDPSVKTVP